MFSKRKMKEADERFDRAFEELKSINIHPPKKKKNGHKTPIPINSTLRH